MKKILIIFLVIIVGLSILGFFLPIVPVHVTGGYHGRGGEWCGIVYNPECDKIVLRFFKWDEAWYLWHSNR